MNNGWWPAAGYRYGGNGILINVGTNAYYWSSTRHSDVYDSYYLNFHYIGYVGPSSHFNRSYSFPIRCVQEERLRFAWDLGREDPESSSG